MDWKDSIKDIIEAKNDNRLVIFVGAGVSKNSNMPTWTELIKNIGRKIGYYNEEDGKEIINEGDYLKIPEYFYNLCEDKKDYFDFVVNELNSNKHSNIIDKLIVDIKPQHIITTNYDKLIENSDTYNTCLYKIIREDKDLLSNIGTHYIIKMHGDIDKPKSIVLKEGDYLDYEFNHPLISTYIKSLLVNSTFLFLGYSLRDYNLALIINWIVFLGKRYSIKSRPNNYIIQTKPVSPFEVSRLEKMNIHTICIENIFDTSINKTNLSREGELLYNYLSYVKDESKFYNYIGEENKYITTSESFKSLQYISMFDIFKCYNISNTINFGGKIIFLKEDECKRIINIISRHNEIKEIFTRSLITLFEYNSKVTYLLTSCSNPLRPNCYSLLNSFYLNNNYSKIESIINKYCYPKNMFFSCIVGDYGKASTLINENEKYIDKNNYNEVLLYKIRKWLVSFSNYDFNFENRKDAIDFLDDVPAKNKDVIGFLKKIVSSPAKDILLMKEKLDNHLKKYNDYNNGWISGNRFDSIFEIQSYVYDYYFYTFINCIPLFRFKDPKIYYSYYIEAIISSYQPINQTINNKNPFPKTDIGPYPLNEIDFDIIIKYADDKSLSKLLEDYKVSKLLIGKEVHLATKFKNMCDYTSVCYSGGKQWGFSNNVLNNFISLIEHYEMNDYETKIIVKSFIKYITSITSPQIFIRDSIFINSQKIISCIQEKYKNSAKEIMSALLHKNYTNNLSDGTWRRLIVDNSHLFSKNDISFVENSITNNKNKKEKIAQIVTFAIIINIDKYKYFINRNINLFDFDQIFVLVINKKIKWTGRINNHYIETIVDLFKQKKPGIKSFPDYLELAITYYISLDLSGYSVDYTKLTNVAESSEYLQFLIEPNNFDYSKIDSNDNVWNSIMKSEKYKKYFENNAR